MAQGSSVSRRWWRSLCIALLVVGAACGEDGDGDAAEPRAESGADQTTTSDAPSGSSAADVCTMLSDDEVQAALGLAVQKKEPGGGQGFATGACRWDLGDGGANDGFATFTVSVRSPDGKSRFDVLADQGLPEIPDLGDDAFQQGDSIWAIEGDGLVVLDYSLLVAEVDDPNQAVRPLIATILETL